MDFVSQLVTKRGKDNLEKVIHFIFDIFQRFGLFWWFIYSSVYIVLS